MKPSTQHLERKTDLPDDVVLSVRGVSKKFCRNLRRSMWYGMQDLGRNFVGLGTGIGMEVGDDQTETSWSPPLRRDEFWGVKDVSFDLRRGEVLGLLGINGCGKTTLLRLIAGIFPPDKGQISVRGRTGSLIALGAGFHPHMTGRENVYLNGSILGLSLHEIKKQLDDIIEFSEIEEFIDAPVSTYSSGMRVRLGFSIAITVKPDLLLIDEVLAVGDMGFKVKCLNAISNVIGNCAVIFVSHSMSLVSRISTKTLVLGHGEILHESSNVGEGIDFFHGQFKKSAQRITGTGAASILSVKLFTNNIEQKDEVSPVQFLESLDLEIAIKLQSGERAARLQVIVWDKEVQAVAYIAPVKKEDFDLLPTTSTQSCKFSIQSMPLKSGRYSVTVLVEDKESHCILCRLDGAKEFAVLGAPSVTATIILSATDVVITV